MAYIYVKNNNIYKLNTYNFIVFQIIYVQILGFVDYVIRIMCTVNKMFDMQH